MQYDPNSLIDYLKQMRMQSDPMTRASLWETFFSGEKYKGTARQNEKLHRELRSSWGEPSPQQQQQLNNQWVPMQQIDQAANRALQQRDGGMSDRRNGGMSRKPAPPIPGPMGFMSQMMSRMPNNAIPRAMGAPQSYTFPNPNGQGSTIPVGGPAAMMGMMQQGNPMLRGMQQAREGLLRGNANGNPFLNMMQPPRPQPQQPMGPMSGQTGMEGAQQPRQRSGFEIIQEMMKTLQRVAEINPEDPMIPQMRQTIQKAVQQEKAKLEANTRLYNTESKKFMGKE